MSLSLFIYRSLEIPFWIGVFRKLHDREVVLSPLDVVNDANCKGYQAQRDQEET